MQPWRAGILASRFLVGQSLWAPGLWFPAASSSWPLLMAPGSLMVAIMWRGALLRSSLGLFSGSSSQGLDKQIIEEQLELGAAPF